MPEKHKLNKQETDQMQKLEQLFHNRYLTPQFLHQLVSIYVKAIESFNNDFVFMRNYFMEKMQFVLSSPEILAMLQGGGDVVDNIRETVRGGTERVMPDQIQVKPKANKKKQETGQSENKGQNRQKQQKQKNEDRFQNVHNESHHHKHVHEQHHHYHYDESKNNQRGLKIDMKMKLMREVQENTKIMQKELHQADKRLEQNQQKVKGITKNQQQQFNERLAKRKKKILRKKSVQIKAKVVKPETQQPEPEPEPIKKQELRDAQRELTQAILKFTIRMTQKQMQMTNNEQKKPVQGRMKKAKRDLDEDQQLLQKQEQNEAQPPPVFKQMNMKKKKTNQAEPVAELPRGRIKTMKRNLDSDDQN